ncbi:MAG: alpha-glucosidase [Proteobacteria bacterium]|nr:alpha-glucosidase [Pseudomonadota bacterium]
MFPRSTLALTLTLAACTEAPPADPQPTEPEDAVEAAANCFADRADALPVVTRADAHAVGAFRIAIRPDAGLDVRHASAPSRSLFASASGAPWTAAQAELTATDRQGSFQVDEAVHAACTMPTLGDVHGDGGTLALRGAFADASAACANLTWEVQLCEPRPGHLAFRITTSDPAFSQLTLRVASSASERIFGMGEQFAHDTLDLKGRVIPVLAQEGGVGRGHTPISPAVNLASPGSAGSEESTYDAVPHYLTSELRSLFLENSELSIFDFTTPEATEIRLHAPTMIGRILFGESPLELIERFTDYAGRMPAPPAWVNDGAIVALARDLPRSQAIVDQLRARGVELAAVWNQTWSGKVRTYIGEQVLWNWVPNASYHPGWNDFVSGLATDHIRTLCYVNPMLVDPPPAAGPVSRNLFAEARDHGYLVTKEDGTPYLLKVTAFDAGLIDLTNPEARTWMKAVLRDEVMGKGRCSGWMVDFGEALPFDARLASGVSGASFHNQYPVEWMRLNREAITEAGRLGDVLTFNRSGSTRTPAYSLLMWQGDQLTTWDKYDGMVSALHGLISGGFSGLALNHSDTGGYTSLSLNGLAGYEREPELLERWTEMNAFTSVLRTHEGNQPDVNAQIYSDTAAIDHFARFSKVYKALAFYRTQLFDEATTRGWPVVRHLWMEDPSDPIAPTIDDEFLLGSEILVAPVKNKCWTWPLCPYDKEVYLPRGTWVHLWTGTVLGSTAAGERVTVKAPIGEPAVFYRKGSAVGARFVANLKAAGITVAPAR